MVSSNQGNWFFLSRTGRPISTRCGPLRGSLDCGNCGLVAMFVLRRCLMTERRGGLLLTRIETNYPNLRNEMSGASVVNNIFLYRFHCSFCRSAANVGAH